MRRIMYFSRFYFRHACALLYTLYFELALDIIFGSFIVSCLERFNQLCHFIVRFYLVFQRDYFSKVHGFSGSKIYVEFYFNLTVVTVA